MVLWVCASDAPGLPPQDEFYRAVDSAIKLQLGAPEPEANWREARVSPVHAYASCAVRLCPMVCTVPQCDARVSQTGMSSTHPSWLVTSARHVEAIIEFCDEEARTEILTRSASLT